MMDDMRMMRRRRQQFALFEGLDQDVGKNPPRDGRLHGGNTLEQFSTEHIGLLMLWVGNPSTLVAGIVVSARPGAGMKLPQHLFPFHWLFFRQMFWERHFKKWMQGARQPP